MRNNFQRIEDEQLVNHPDPPARIKHDIDHSQSVFQLFGNVIDLFIPKLFQMITSLLGSTESKPNRSPENKPPRYPNLDN